MSPTKITTSSLVYLAITLSAASAFSPIEGLSGHTLPRCIPHNQVPAFRTTRGSTVEANLFRKIFRRDKKDGEDDNNDVMDGIGHEILELLETLPQDIMDICTKQYEKNISNR